MVESSTCQDVPLWWTFNPEILKTWAVQKFVNSLEIEPMRRQARKDFCSSSLCSGNSGIVVSRAKNWVTWVSSFFDCDRISKKITLSWNCFVTGCAKINWWAVQWILRNFEIRTSLNSLPNWVGILLFWIKYSKQRKPGGTCLPIAKWDLDPLKFRFSRKLGGQEGGGWGGVVTFKLHLKTGRCAN